VTNPFVDNAQGGFLPPQSPLTDGNHVRGVTFGRQIDGSRTTNYGIPLSQTSFEQTPFNLVPGLAGAQGLGGTTMGIAFLNDIDVYMLMEAVASDQRSNVMQAPKVTLFNGQSAQVFVGRTVPFVVGAEPVIGNGAVAFNPIIQTFPDGTFMTVQAVVSADRRYVRLNIVPVIQTLESDNPRTISVGGTAGGGFGVGGGAGGGGGAAGNATATIQLPIFNQVFVATTVSVPDGGTVLLGGLKVHQERRNESGTPVLSKIPYLNRLFKNHMASRITRSLLLTVSPRIIILAEEEENLGIPQEYIGIQ
jgi:general secretion pathway protein D